MKAEHFLHWIWEEYQENIRDRIDPIYTATRLAKHTTMHCPFRDANRRTGFLWATQHFDAFGHMLRVDTPEAIEYKNRMRQSTFREVYNWFRDEIEKIV